MSSVDYDSIAATYDRRYALNDYGPVQQALLAFARETERGAVLEAGCGTGHWLRVLTDAGLRVAGIDASFNMLRHARRGAGIAALAHAKAERLPWRAGVFARVYCVNALHHFDDPRGFMVEARRVLAPGGRLLTIGVDPHTGADQWYVYDYFAGARERDQGRYAAAPQIQQWLREAGFVGVDTREVQHMGVRLPARGALESGRLAKNIGSQLALLTDQEYEQGLERIQAAMRTAEAKGETLHLTADLRLYGTYATAPR